MTGLQRTEECIDVLQRTADDAFEPGNFCVKKINSHGKIFICDEKYYVLTSMNPLSNDGASWQEIGEKSQNLENLRRYREQHFNF